MHVLRRLSNLGIKRGGWAVWTRCDKSESSVLSLEDCAKFSTVGRPDGRLLSSDDWIALLLLRADWHRLQAGSLLYHGSRTRSSGSESEKS